LRFHGRKKYTEKMVWLDEMDTCCTRADLTLLSELGDVGFSFFSHTLLTDRICSFIYFATWGEDQLIEFPAMYALLSYFNAPVLKAIHMGQTRLK
jgi:hypothetical protein